MGYYYNPIEITATSDGLTTGLIPVEAGVPAAFVSVTSASADNIITLPSQDLIPVGWQMWGYVGANGCEMRTDADSGETINGTDADGTNEAAIPATTVIHVVKTAADTFVMMLFDEAGDDIAGVTPD